MSDNDLKVIQKFDAVGTNVKADSLQEAKVVNLYQEVKPSAPVKAPEVVAETKVEIKETEPTRRDALKRASEAERRAMEVEKTAKEKLAKAEEFHKFFEQAKEDPTVLAKALGMETGDFLKKIQNKVLEIPVEAPKPEEVAQKRLIALEEQTKKLAQANFEAKKNEYVHQTIMPVLSKEVEKFQLINENKDFYAPYIYDLIQSHWLETGGEKGGEVWSVEKVAEQTERVLTEMQEKQLQELKKSPKLKKFFKEEVEVQEIKSTPVKTITSSLGANASGGLPTLPKENDNGAKIVYSGSLDPREARRQRTAQAIKAQFPDRFTKNKK